MTFAHYMGDYVGHRNAVATIMKFLGAKPEDKCEWGYIPF